MEILKVSSKSNPSKVAGAIANIYREKGSVELQTIGAGSLNQAIKAIAIARGFVAPSGVDLVCIPAFAEVQVEGEVDTSKAGTYNIKVFAIDANGNRTDKEFTITVKDKPKPSSS